MEPSHHLLFARRRIHPAEVGRFHTELRQQCLKSSTKTCEKFTLFSEGTFYCSFAVAQDAQHNFHTGMVVVNSFSVSSVQQQLFDEKRWKLATDSSVQERLSTSALRRKWISGRSLKNASKVRCASLSLRVRVPPS